MEDLNRRFGIMADDIKAPAEDNAYDYFERLFGIAPLDFSLRELPINSECGADCKDAMDWIHACYRNRRFEMAWRMACSHIDRNAYPQDCERLNQHYWGIDILTIQHAARIAFDAIEIYWRG